MKSLVSEADLILEEKKIPKLGGISKSHLGFIEILMYFNYLFIGFSLILGELLFNEAYCSKQVVEDEFNKESIPLILKNSLSNWNFDGKIWSINDGVITGGSLDEKVKKNHFISSKMRYQNFDLRFQIKCQGDPKTGFINSGIQIRSELEPNTLNVAGYQVDCGKGWFGTLYDEHRRKHLVKKVLNPEALSKVLDVYEWNSYRILAIGKKIKVWINGVQTLDYTETHTKIPMEGIIAIQLHSGGKCLVQFKDMRIKQLPKENAKIPTWSSLGGYKNAISKALSTHSVPVKKNNVPSKDEILGRFGRGVHHEQKLQFKNNVFEVQDNEVIAILGQENLVREQFNGDLEARIQSSFIHKNIVIRPMAWQADTVYEQWRERNFGNWLDQLKTVGSTMLIVQYGQIEAMDGIDKVQEFVTTYNNLLDEFTKQTERIVLVSPMPFEKNHSIHAPNLEKFNNSVMAYAEAIKSIAQQRNAFFVDLSKLNTSLKTDNGMHLNDHGLNIISEKISYALGAKAIPSQELKDAVVIKNRYWFDCWRPSNWNFAYGDRIHVKYGQKGHGLPSLHESISSQLPYVEKADESIHQIKNGINLRDLKINSLHNKRTTKQKLLRPEKQIESFKVNEGFEINLFASEIDGVVNPVQMAWDSNRRLYIACSPSYPQSLVGSPGDYIQVVEDTDGDGKADKSWRFADGLTMVQGVLPSDGNGGVYVCDFNNLLHLRDLNKDGIADEKKIVYSGFGIGDTHQLINSICYGMDGSIWFSQGLHVRSRVETPWGIEKLDRSALWRLNPRKQKLYGYFDGAKAGSNCYGIEFDDYGQVFHKSGDRPHGYWSTPGLIQTYKGGIKSTTNFPMLKTFKSYHQVGPMFGGGSKSMSMSIIGSEALPKEFQGDAVIAGFMSSEVELYKLNDYDSGFNTTKKTNLIKSDDKSFRPVDISMGPDGAIYIADWHNPVIGHYQSHFNDPKRDFSHGRIWRLSHKSKKKVVMPNFSKLSIYELLNQFKSKERWNRDQARKLLFSCSTQKLVPILTDWIKQTSDEKALLQALGVLQSHQVYDSNLIRKLLNSKDYKIRSFATRALAMEESYSEEVISKLRKMARDKHSRVRLEAIVASSYIPHASSVKVLADAFKHKRDDYIDYAIGISLDSLKPFWEPALINGTFKFENAKQKQFLEGLLQNKLVKQHPGEEVYQLACLSCHQSEGQGLKNIYPPVANSDWVKGDKSRLIKIILHGLSGPITVSGKKYGLGNEALPMPALGGLSDKKIADVLNFIRSEYNHIYDDIGVDEVKRIRDKTINRSKPWSQIEFNDEILK